METKQPYEGIRPSGYLPRLAGQLRLPSGARDWLAAHGWLAFIVIGAALTVSYFLLPSPQAQDIYYQLPETLAVVAVLVGIGLHKPANSRPWQMLAAGLALTTAGDWTWVVLDRVYGIEPFPSVADVFYLAGLALLVGASLWLVRGRISEGDRAGLLDTAIITVGAGLLTWVFLMAPLTADAGAPADEVVAALAYPLIDIALLGIVVRVLLTPGRMVPALQLLTGAIVAFLVADYPYAFMALQGGYDTGNAVDAGWLIGSVMWGASALHPSMRAPAGARVEVGEARLTAGRLAVLAAASLMAPAVLVFQWASGTPVDVPVIAAGCVILFSLVIARLAGVVADLRTTLAQRRALETELERRALHDPLTGLANRTLFAERLTHALAHRDRHVTVMFADLDDFKTVNDASGHAAGDAVLRGVADAIGRSLRPEDTVARLGGDEFAILLDQGATPYDAGQVAARVIDAVHEPIPFEGSIHVIGASIGIALGVAGTDTAETLMRDADIAMYVAKGQGKGRFVTFEPTQHESVLRGFELRTDLEAALRGRQFELHYQPIVDLELGDLAGVEALVRWHHPRRGLLQPEDFVPLAEATGAIVPIGEWILGEAIRQASVWAAATPPGPTGGSRFLTVNLAAAQLADPGFADLVAGLLRGHRLPPAQLVLEVTESARLEGPVITETLRRLHELGVHLAIDDFGTRFAALSHLAHVPFDIVKVDRLFVSDLPTDARAESLMTGVADLARRLNARLVVEGIETPEELAVLRRIGVPLGQGFHFSRPMPPRELEALVNLSPAIAPAAVAPRPRRAAAARRRPAASPDTSTP